MKEVSIGYADPLRGHASSSQKDKGRKNWLDESLGMQLVRPGVQGAKRRSWCGLDSPFGQQLASKPMGPVSRPQNMGNNELLQSHYMADATNWTYLSGTIWTLWKMLLAQRKETSTKRRLSQLSGKSSSTGRGHVHDQMHVIKFTAIRCEITRQFL